MDDHSNPDKREGDGLNQRGGALKRATSEPTPGAVTEHPEDHDFDQRADGPEEAAFVPTASGPARESSQEEVPRPYSEKMKKTVSLPKDENTRKVSLPAVNTAVGKSTRFDEAMTAPVRSKSEVANPGFDTPPRRSTQMSRSGGRTSRDFDRRTDGPFGRPSLAMTRRRSSAFTIPTNPNGRPSLADGRPSIGARAAEGADEEGREAGEAPSDDQPPSIETLQSTDMAFEPEPPPLNYTLQTRKWSIFFFWSLILIDSIAMPIGLYFGLWYGTSLSPNTVFSIVTAALGGASIIEYCLRFWRLWKHSSTCRVIGARRAYLDWFHWNFSFAWFVVMVELIVGTVFPNPPIRLLSMPLATMLYTFGTELLIIDILRYFQVPAPIRISSVPKGSQLRPCIYSIIEDVCAVDGSGGTKFREDLNRRYEASHIFRAMLRRLGVFWAFGAEGMAIACTIMIFTLSHNAAYTIGWTVPFMWAGIWTLATIWYVKRMLKEEKRAWTEEVATKSNA